MTRLLLADLRRHAGTWTWTVAVAVVTGACVAGQFMVMRGSLDSARATADASMIEAASVVTTFIIVSVVLAAAAVLTSTSALAVVERERDHGLWRALGMRPIVLRVVVLGQLVVVAPSDPSSAQRPACSSPASCCPSSSMSASPWPAPCRGGNPSICCGPRSSSRARP